MKNSLKPPCSRPRSWSKNQESSDAEIAIQPQRICILLNPKSGHVRRNLECLRALCAQIPRACTYEVSTPEEIEKVVSSESMGGDDLLIVAGGDGSLQATLTAVLRNPLSPPPLVMPLSGGTTNMSAVDLGARFTPAEALGAVKKWVSANAKPPRIKVRTVIQVSGSDSSKPQFGLFFGAGAVLSGVKYFHSNVRPKGVRGALGPSIAFVRMLISLLRKSGRADRAAVHLALQLQQHYLYSQWLFVLATTLDKLLLGSSPFWGTEHGPMRLTAVAHRAPRLLISLPSIWRGKTNEAMQNKRAYVSENLTHATIHNLEEYLLDGEIFASPCPVYLSATATVRFASF